MVNASNRLVDNHHFNHPRLHVEGPQVGRGHGEVANPEFAQLASVSSFATSLLKATDNQLLAEKGDQLGQYFGSVISGRAILSGQALEDIENDFASADPQERAKFWTAASSFIVPANAAVQLVESHYAEKAVWVAENVGKISTILAPLAETIRGERAGASTLVALKSLERMSSRASTRERVVTHSGVVEAAGGVAKIAASAMGFPSVSLGFGLLSNLAGMIKAFTKSPDFVPYQNPLDKEFLSIKNKALAIVKNQFTQAISELKQSDLPEQQTELIAALEMASLTRTREIEESPDEEVLQRTLIYYDIESHSLFSSQLFGEWKTDQVLDLCQQCSTLTDKKIELADIKSGELISQKESIDLLQERLDQFLLDLDEVYKEGSIMKEFIGQDIKSVRGLLMEEAAKIDSMLLEKKQNIDERPPLPMFEAHELTEDLTKRPNITEWLERADDLVSQERRVYLEKKVASTFEEPSLVDIIHI